MFTEKDLAGIQCPHNDTLVITLKVGKAKMERILVDQGSAAEVMYCSLFKRFEFISKDLKPSEVPLIGFSGTPMYLLDTITLLVIARLVK